MRFEIWIDGGTTNTRFTLTEDVRVLERVSRHVGASSAETDGNRALREAVAEEMAVIQARHGLRAERVVIAGMITSGSGLYELPHVPAPAGVRELAAGAKQVEMPDVTPAPILCLPGVKCFCDGQSDMMRGEEVEVMGALGAPEEGPRAFIHFGSHNKLILTENGRITRSKTTLTGELLTAVTGHTILAGTLGAPDGTLTLSEEFVLRGFHAAQENGLSRALFQTRLLQTLDGAERNEAYSFLFGALCQQDLAAFGPWLRETRAPLTLYGREIWEDAFLCCAKEAIGETNATRIGYQESQWLSLRGMQRVVGERE